MNPQELKNLSDAQDRTTESRIYFILLRGVPLSTPDLLHAVATLTINIAQQATPEQLEKYHPVLQPKICLRAKNPNNLRNMIEEARYFAEVPTASLTHDGDIYAAAIGPIPADEVTATLKRGQVFHAFAEGFPNLPYAPPAIQSNDPTLNIYYRTDIDIPIGKLVAQVGHAAWTAIRQRPSTNSINITLIPSDATSISNLDDAHVIWDAGRTVFNEPTMTTAAQWR